MTVQQSHEKCLKIKPLEKAIRNGSTPEKTLQILHTPVMRQVKKQLMICC